MPRRPTHDHDFSQRPLGGYIPPDRTHIERYPLLAGMANPLGLEARPSYVMHPIGVRYDQGEEGACVGMACAAWLSHRDWHCREEGRKRVKYDAFEIYERAQRIDEWPGEDYSGTSVRAGLEILRADYLITEYRWAIEVRDVLDHVCFQGPVVMGMAWYENFDRPVKHPFNGGRRQQFFIGEGDLGSTRGAHAIILQGYYRNRQGHEWVRFQNSWGFDYPLVWMPVSTLQSLFQSNQAEAAMVVR